MAVNLPFVAAHDPGKLDIVRRHIVDLAERSQRHDEEDGDKNQKNRGRIADAKDEDRNRQPRHRRNRRQHGDQRQHQFAKNFEITNPDPDRER